MLSRLQEERDDLHKRISEKDMENEFLKKLEETEPALRLAMVDRASEMPVSKQCRWLGIKRGKVYHVRQISAKKQKLLDRVDELYTDDPTRGQRRLIYALRNEFGIDAGRDAIRWAMNVLNIEAVYLSPTTL